MLDWIKDNLGIAKALARIGEALVRKDLREPSNWNILFDIILVLFVLGLSIICGTFHLTNHIPLFWCVVLAFLFILVCLSWTIYVYSKKS